MLPVEMAAGRSRVHDWRRRARLGQLVLPAPADTLSFVALVSEASPPAVAESSRSPDAAVVTVEFWGARVEGSRDAWP